MRADTIEPQEPVHTWVVRLRHHGQVAPGSVGPFASEDEASAWATASVPPGDDWEWDLEVVVAPAALPVPAEHVPDAPRHRHLRLVR
jgi:hypothetical protein